MCFPLSGLKFLCVGTGGLKVTVGIEVLVDLMIKNVFLKTVVFNSTQWLGLWSA